MTPQDILSMLLKSYVKLEVFFLVLSMEMDQTFGHLMLNFIKCIYILFYPVLHHVAKKIQVWISR